MKLPKFSLSGMIQTIRQHIIMVIAVVIVVVLGIVGIEVSSGKKYTKGDALDNLTFTTVQNRDIVQSFTTQGTIESKKVVQLKSEVKGTLTALHVKPGDEVKAGDLLGEITSDDAFNNLVTAEQNYDVSKISYDEAVRNFNQTKTLYKLKSVPRNNYIDQKNNLEKAEFNLKASKKSLGYAKKKVESTKVRSKIDGKVLNVAQSVGSDVSEGTALFEVADMNRLVVKLSISSLNANRIKVGQKAIIMAVDFLSPIGSDTGGFETKIDTISQAAKGGGSSDSSGGSKVTAEAHYHVDDTDNVILGEMVEAKIVLAEKKDVPSVPLNSVWGEKNQFHVFSKEGKVYKSVPISIGISNAEFVEITSDVSGIKEVAEVKTWDEFDPLFDLVKQSKTK